MPVLMCHPMHAIEGYQLPSEPILRSLVNYQSLYLRDQLPAPATSANMDGRRFWPSSRYQTSECAEPSCQPRACPYLSTIPHNQSIVVTGRNGRLRQGALRWAAEGCPAALGR
jgi:hypothetical protein